MITAEKKKMDSTTERASGGQCASGATGAPECGSAAQDMSPAEIRLANKCRNCRFCNYARKKPETVVGRVMNWHGKTCPAWRALQKLENAEQA